jgi:hypothetical protein
MDVTSADARVVMKDDLMVALSAALSAGETVVRSVGLSVG